MDEFDYETELTVRYRDLDPFGHVNNAVYATYCEQARVRYFGDRLGLPTVDPPYVVAHLQIDYERPIRDVDSVLVGVDVVDVGRSSVRLAFELRAGDDVAATAETVLVHVGSAGGEPRPVPEAWRRALEADSTD